MPDFPSVLRLCHSCQRIIARSVRTRPLPIRRLRQKDEAYFPQEQEELERRLDASPFTHRHKLQLDPDTPGENPRSLSFAIVGAPNAGKSVLTNYLVGGTVSPVSKKVHTTRRLSRAITIEGSTQMVCYDTPGIMSPETRNKIEGESSLVHDPELSIRQAQLIGVVVDASNSFTRTRLHSRILHLLHRYSEKPSILILNKVDLFRGKGGLLGLAHRLCKGYVGGHAMARKSPQLLSPDSENRSLAENLSPVQDSVAAIRSILSEYRREKAQEKSAEIFEEFGSDGVSLAADTSREKEQLAKVISQPGYKVLESQIRRVFDKEHGWPHFDALFMVSALTGDGMQDLKNYLVDKASAGPWKYHSTVLTDKDPIRLACDVVRAQLLDVLPQEIPYSIQMKVAVWEVNEHGVLCIRLDLICEHARIAKMVIGPKGDRIRQISQEANQQLRNVFQRDVFMRLGVMSLKQ